MKSPVLKPIVTRVVTERKTALFVIPDGGNPKPATHEDLEMFVEQLDHKGPTCCMPDCEESPHYCKAHYESELTAERASYDRSRRELLDQVQDLGRQVSELLDELAETKRALGETNQAHDETKAAHAETLAALERTAEERDATANELAELRVQQEMAAAAAGADVEPPRKRGRGGKRRAG